MKAKIKSISAIIGGWILSILGIGCSSTSCSVMYGCPYSDFVLKGVVTDSESNPLKGIKVTLQCNVAEDNEDGNSPVINQDIYTDENGAVRYHDSYSMIIDFDYYEYSILLEDIDGPENGGEFEPKTISANIVKVGDSDGSWDMGDYECTFKASLDKVKSE